MTRSNVEQVALNEAKKIICPNCGHHNDPSVEKCANCGQDLNGRMLFYPKLCLQCVVEEHNNDFKNSNRQARGGHAK